MRSKKLRIASVFVSLAALLALTGLFAPGASAAVGDLQVAIVNQPADAGVGDLITAEAFDPTGGENGFVQVHVTVDTGEGFSDLPGAEVTFELPEGSPSMDLTVESRFTNADGVATFAPEEGSENPLSIGTPNQPFTTGYQLIPVATPPPSDIEISSLTTDSTQGIASDPFDIWEAGCNGDGCQVNLTPGTSSDEYTLGEPGGMGASQLGLGGTNIVCPTQQLIFSTNLFFHATTGDEPVFLISHISAADRKKVANNGNKVMGWCVGLKDKGPWNFPRRNTNGDGVTDPNNGTWVPGSDLWVGMAPKCPKKNASNFAPCIVSQTGDGVGGTFIRGWLPGGDPPRRT